MFVLVEFHKDLVGLFLKLVWVPLYDSSALQHIHCFLQFGVICKFGRSALRSLSDLQVTGKNVTWDGSQYRPLWQTTYHWSPDEVWPLNHDHVLIIHLDFHLSSCSPPDFNLDRGILGETLSKAKAKANGTTCSP